MGELSAEEKKQLCEDFKAYQKKVKPNEDETLRMTCLAKGVLSTAGYPAKDDADVRGACKKAADECIAKKEKMPEAELDCNSPNFIAKMSECKDLTIGEVSDCVKDMGGVMKSFAAMDHCSALKAGDADAAMKMFGKMKSPKCEAIETKCMGKAGPTVEPKTTGVPSEKVEKETIAGLTDFKTKMCACKDKACGETVRAEMSAWGERMAKEHTDFKPSAAATTQVTDLVNDYTNCMLKVAGEPPPPVPMEAPTPAK